MALRVHGIEIDVLVCLFDDELVLLEIVGLLVVTLLKV